MPIYGYKCESCGHEFEVLQKMSDAPLTACPKCSGKLRKLMYPAGVIFKGSGYYTTDYKGSSKAGDSGSSNGSDSAKTSGKAAEKASDSSGDSKPAAEPKAESKPAKSDSTD